jgi:hypothetical protein
MAQIQQIFNFGLNLASLNESGQRDGFHNRQDPNNPSLINVTRNSIISANYRSFFKSGQIKDRAFETRTIGRKPSDSPEIDFDSRFTQASPPIEHRTRTWIRKREPMQPPTGVVGNKHKCRRDHDVTATAAQCSRFNSD